MKLSCTVNKQQWVLVFILLLSLFLRVVYQWGRLFEGDEIGTIIWLQKLDYTTLITSFHNPWLTMPFYVAFMKAMYSTFEGNSWMLVLPSLLAGIGLVLVIYFLSLELEFDSNIALGAAFLVAVNPFLVIYSVFIRSYGLMVFFAMLALLLFLRWIKEHSWKNGILVAVCLMVSIILHTNAVYHALFIGMLFLLLVRLKDRKNLTVVLPVGLAALGTILLYAPMLKQMLIYKNTYSVPPPSEVFYLPAVTRLFFADGMLAVPAILFLILGIWASVRYSNDASSYFIFGVIIPIFCSSLVGVSVPQYAMARFLITTLPLLILFIAEGVYLVSAMAGKRRLVGGAILFAVIGASWLPSYVHSLDRKKAYQWDNVAIFLNNHLLKGDHIVPLARMSIFNLSSPALFKPVDKNFFVRNITDFFENNGEVGALFIISELPLDEKKLMYKKGNILIYKYEAQTVRKQGIEILKDLKTTLSEVVIPSHTPYFKAVIDIQNGLEQKDEMLKYTALYYESRLIMNRNGNWHTQTYNSFMKNNRSILAQDIRPRPLSLMEHDR